MAVQYGFKAQTIIDEERTTRAAITEIKDWLRETKLPHISEELVVLFLLSCENVIKDTKKTIKAYFKIKRSAPEMFSARDIDSEELKKAISVVHYISIPKRMNNNTVIHFFRINDTNYQNFDWLHSMKLAYMLLDISQQTNPPNELVVVIDMKGLSFMHLTRFKIGAAKTFLEFLQEGMPLKINMIHILNSNYIFEKLLSIARVFIKSELMAILKTHPAETDMVEFQKEHIPATYLPKDYGGELPSTEELNQNSIQQFKELKEFFEAEEKLISHYNN